MTPTIADLFATVDAPWPAAALHPAGPWLVREGRGGGKRVSAAAAGRPVAVADLAAMEAAQAALHQSPLVMIRQGEDALDALLAAQGYRIVDPVVIYLAPTTKLTGALPHLAAFPVWPPLAIQAEVWAAGHIGPERMAVMNRVAGSKTSIFARTNDRAAGAAFVGVAGDIAMLHALEVSHAMRRQGSAANMMRAAANWAQTQGAGWFSLVVTETNAPARALYASLGMSVVGQYHYRMK
ncbi:putative acetyltransferase [mine drainage metagenome]|uniref:Putative acetyltransferase n=1 Tax=mine drainage metagenome TaxID=410659 RepID=A0A1J5QIR7_9ZZZZ